MATSVHSTLRRTIYVNVDNKDCTCELKDAIEKKFGDSPYFEGKNQIIFVMQMNHAFIDYSDEEIAAEVNKMIVRVREDEAREKVQDEQTYKKHDSVKVPELTQDPLVDAIRAAIEKRVDRENEYAGKGDYGTAMMYRNDAEDLYAIHKFAREGKWYRALQSYKVLDTIVKESIPYTVAEKIRQLAGKD